MVGHRISPGVPEAEDCGQDVEDHTSSPRRRLGPPPRLRRTSASAMAISDRVFASISWNMRATVVSDGTEPNRSSPMRRCSRSRIRLSGIAVARHHPFPRLEGRFCGH